MNNDLNSSATGILLYPATTCNNASTIEKDNVLDSDKFLDSSVTIQNHKFRFVTVNLNETTQKIQQRLLDIVEQ